jgi:tRNA pseudouridine13 synthase
MTKDDADTIVASVPAPALPYLTADLPGVGGVIKRFDEDFFVEEAPLYPASGEGTHLYLTIEKRGVTTLEAVRRIGQALGIASRQIGYAGLKDAHAVTRQRISVEHIEARRIESLDLPGIEVTSIERHTNKIKLGHLAGNRFRIRVRETSNDPLPRVAAIMEVLGRRGGPNYFGPQRFGARGDNAKIGSAVLRGDYDEAIAMMLGRPTDVDRPDIRHARALFDEGRYEASMAAWSGRFAEQKRVVRTFVRSGRDARRAWLATAHPLRKLLMSSVQSDLFNRVLARRLGEIDRVYAGDLAWKHANGACFRVEDVTAEQPRCDAFEVSPTGPLFGQRMTEAEGRPAEIESSVLSESRLTLEHFRPRDGIRLDGARRPLRIPLLEPNVQWARDDAGGYVELQFTLPPGGYATCVTREVCKEPGS